MRATRVLVLFAWTGVAFAQSPATGPAPAGAVPTGDAARGRAIFEGKGECLGCHRVGDKGARFGPDLTDIGTRAGIAPARGAAAASPFAPIPPDIGPVARAQAHIKRALIEPAADILPQNRTINFVTVTGETGTARLLNQDTFSVQIIDRKERVRTIPKSELREFSFIKGSPMPSYKDKLSAGETDDVVAYLVSLKGINK